jgi:glutamyl-tRNA reductase
MPESISKNPSSCKLVCLSLNHHHADTQTREQFWLNQERIERARKRLKKISDQVVLLSTCNRVEAYLLADRLQETDAYSQKALGLLYPDLSAVEFEPWIQKSGKDAVRHFLEVTCSLDSMVVGETQITGQIKKAVEGAVAAKVAGSYFSDLIAHGLRANKEIRSSTDIGKYPVSVSHAAMHLAGKVISNIPRKNIAIVGAGEMARLSIQVLIAKGVKELTLFNRTIEKAHRLAGEFSEVKIKAIDLTMLRQKLREYDLILFATNAQGYLVHKADVCYSMDMPQVFLDFCVPVNVDPKTKACDNTFLFTLEDIQHNIRANKEARSESLRSAQGIVGEQVQNFVKRQKDKLLTGEISAFLEELKNPLQKFSASLHDRVTELDTDTKKEIAKDLKVLEKRLHSLVIRRERSANNP